MNRYRQTLTLAIPQHVFESPDDRVEARLLGSWMKPYCPQPVSYLLYKEARRGVSTFETR